MNAEIIKKVIAFHAGEPATVAEAEARLDFWANLPDVPRQLVDFRNSVLNIIHAMWRDDAIDSTLKSNASLVIRAGAADYLLEGDAANSADAVLAAVAA